MTCEQFRSILRRLVEVEVQPHGCGSVDVEVGCLAFVEAFGRQRCGIVTWVGRARAEVAFVTPRNVARIRRKVAALSDVRILPKATDEFAKG
jgi:hypothetical protein